MADSTGAPQALIVGLRDEQFPLVIEYLDGCGAVTYTMTIPAPGVSDIPVFCFRHQPVAIRVRFGDGRTVTRRGGPRPNP